MREKIDPIALVAVMLPMIIGSAFVFQYMGYAPCELCLLERKPYFAGLFLLILLFLFRHSNTMVRRIPVPEVIKFALFVDLLVSFGFGTYHVGVESGWWAGPTACTGGLDMSNMKDLLASLNKAQVVACDKPAILVFGFSLSVWNAVLSLFMACLTFSSLGASRKREGRV